MRTLINIDVNNIPFEFDIHSIIGQLQITLQEKFNVEVQVEINDFDSLNRIELSGQLRSGAQHALI